GSHLAVPAVRRLAKELGVDLTTVSGTGPDGRVMEADVRAAASPPGLDGGPKPRPSRRKEDAGPAKRLPLRGVRRAIAEHLLDAQRNTAPYTFVEEADFTELVGLR